MADDAILDALQRLEVRLQSQMQALHGEMLRRFDGVDQRLEAIDGRFDTVDERFKTVAYSLNAIDQRFDGIEQQIKVERNWVSGNFDAIFHRFDRLETEYQSLSAGVKRLEEAQQPPM